MNNEANKKAKELIKWFYNAQMQVNQDFFGNQLISIELVENLAKKCALKVAKSEWEVLEQSRVFEEHDFYLELFNEIENYE
jgi:hypothetical protein